MIKCTLILLFVFLFKPVFSQSYKGLYIDNFHLILGNQQQEDSLLTYLSANHFTSIALYNLHQLDYTSEVQMSELRNFISRARLEANITDVTATAENAWFFATKILPFNLASSPLEMMNVFNLEFEFWVPEAVSNYYCSTYLQDNGYSCDESGAFAFYMHELSSIDSITSAHSWKTEVYLGWFNQSQADQIKTKADRILLSNYQSNPENCFDVSLQRLQYLGTSLPDIDVAALFSSEDVFLHPWLLQEGNDPDHAYSMFQTEYQAENGIWKNNINLVGQHWFTYSTMNYQLGTANLSDDGPETKFSCFPTVFNEHLNIKCSEAINLEIFNTQNQLVKSLHLAAKSSTIELKDLAPGIYFIRSGNTIQKILKV